MGTNAYYKFNNEEKVAYIHYDSYPSGAREYLNNAIKNGGLNIESLSKVTKVSVEDDMSVSTNFVYYINEEENKITIRTEWFESANFNGEYKVFTFFTNTFLSLDYFLNGKWDENTLLKQDNQYRCERQLAIERVEQEIKNKELLEEQERNRCDLEKVVTARGLKEKTKTVETNHHTIEVGKTYLIITHKNTGYEVAYFVNDTVDEFHEYWGDFQIKSITEKTVSTIGGGRYGNNMRIKLNDFAYRYGKSRA